MGSVGGVRGSRLPERWAQRGLWVALLYIPGQKNSFCVAAECRGGKGSEVPKACLVQVRSPPTKKTCWLLSGYFLSLVLEKRHGAP